MPDENQHPTSQRKNATVLFADLSGFTAMSANLDPEEVRDIVNRYFEALSTAVRRYEGSIDKYIGDCVMAVFGVPATHENDAERACRAALDMRLAVRDLASSFGGEFQAPDIHIGINTGLVVAAPMGSGDGSQFTVMGDAVNLASRLCHEAENGQIAVGESTWAQVARDFDFAPKELRSIKGKTEKVPVFFLRAHSQKGGRDQKRLRPAMVGRAREVALAKDLLADARNRHGSLLYITGDPGLGKSRLSSEISEWATVNGYRVLSAAAQPLATIEPYSLLAQILVELIGLAVGMSLVEVEAAFEIFLQSNAAYPAQAAVLRATIGLPTSEFELLDEAGRFNSVSRGWNTVLHVLEAESPLLLVLDDLQWADPFSMRLIDQVIEFIPSHAVVFCCLARHEFHNSWASRSYYHQITLCPLSAEDSTALVRALLKGGAIFNEAEVVARAEGNPFYLTELAQSAAQRGEATLPATIEGVILERIDRLGQQSRQILELASVIGREFSERLLRAVANTEHLESQLRSLRDLEFIYEKEIVPELLYLFKHYLTQEVTYNSILIQRRKEMHRQIAAAIEQIYKDGLDRYYSVLAQHYEKAAEYRRAFECYRLAGDRAQGTTSVSAAAQLYERGETALQMDRPVLRNKLKYFAISGGACLVLLIALGWILRVLDSHFNLVAYSATCVIELVIIFGVIVLWFQRWSFLIYQDRIRIRSKRRIVDIPFERITGIQIVSSRGWAPRAHWTFFRSWLDPRYPKYGWGQVRVMGGLREIIRINCAHGKWRKGYHLDMEEPQSFLLTLNRALQRYRVIQSSKLTGPSPR
jgi:class 3 adenylate cyclase